MSTKHPIWDIPTRLFHWLLVLTIVTAWATEELDWMQWHSYAGYMALGLILFRLGWGVFGSVHSRFRDFVRGPAAVRAYFRGETGEYKGHNPAGAWSVLILLTLVLAQAVTGLFNANDESFAGPLNALVSSGVADALGELHEIIFNALMVFVVLHVLAVIWYVLIKGDNILAAMITGQHPDKSGARAPVGLWRAILWGGICMIAVWLIVTSVPTPQFF